MSQPPLEPLRKFRDVAEGVRARETGDGRNHAVQSGRQGIKRAASAALRTPLSAGVMRAKLRSVAFYIEPTLPATLSPVWCTCDMPFNSST